MPSWHNGKLTKYTFNKNDKLMKLTSILKNGYAVKCKKTKWNFEKWLLGEMAS